MVVASRMDLASLAHPRTAPDSSPSPTTKEWERVGERAIQFDKSTCGPEQRNPPLPIPLLHFMEERGSVPRAFGGSIKMRPCVFNPEKIPCAQRRQRLF